jgi:hypothetical protein
MSYHKTLLFAGISATALVIYFIILSMIVTIAFFLGVPLDLTFTVNPVETAFFCGSLLVFEAVFHVFANFILLNDVNRLENKRYQLLKLAGDLLLLGGMTVAAVYTAKSEINIMVRIAIGMTLVCAAARPFLSLVYIFMNVMVYRIFFSKLFLQSRYSQMFSMILEMNNLITRNIPLMNICKRFRINLGAVMITLENGAEIGDAHGDHGLTAVIKQISFMLSENSRSYEPWGFDRNSHVFFCFMQIITVPEFDLTVSRFKRLFEKNNFAYNNADIVMKIKINYRLYTFDELNSLEFANDQEAMLALMVMLQSAEEGLSR